jgi:hypothetical protein
MLSRNSFRLSVLYALQPALQPRQPLPGIFKLGEAGVGVLPEVEEFLVILYSYLIRAHSMF